jgi:hypothetical protein
MLHLRPAQASDLQSAASPRPTETYERDDPYPLPAPVPHRQAKAGRDARGEDHTLTIYVAPMSNHFDEYFLAGVQAEKVPVVVLKDRRMANYEVGGFSKSEAPGWKRMLLLRTDDTTERAAVQVVNLATGDQDLSISAYKLNTSRGMQSTGEVLAKRLKRAIAESAPSQKDMTNSSLRPLSKAYIDPVQDGFDGYLTRAIKQNNIPVSSSRLALTR